MPFSPEMWLRRFVVLVCVSDRLVPSHGAWLLSTIFLLSCRVLLCLDAARVFVVVPPFRRPLRIPVGGCPAAPLPGDDTLCLGC